MGNGPKWADLGGITGLTAHYGLGLELWSFVIGHGVIELSVIFMAGGAGLMLGWALIHQVCRRKDSLILAACKAISLLAGGIPLLVVAGLIEGFFSPAEDIQVWFKWAVGLGSGILLYSYLLLSGRSRKDGTTLAKFQDQLLNHRSHLHQHSQYAATRASPWCGTPNRYPAPGLQPPRQPCDDASGGNLARFLSPW